MPASSVNVLQTFAWRSCLNNIYSFARDTAAAGLPLHFRWSQYHVLVHKSCFSIQDAETSAGACKIHEETWRITVMLSWQCLPAIIDPSVVNVEISQPPQLLQTVQYWCPGALQNEAAHTSGGYLTDMSLSMVELSLLLRFRDSTLRGERGRWHLLMLPSHLPA